MFDTPIIYYGPDYEKVLEKARDEATLVLGKSVGHPDYLEIIPEGKNYLKDQITEFLHDVALSPYQSTYKIHLFQNADKMLPVHANALLKTLEEKPSHAVIFLVTDNIKSIIETILSRCKKIYVPPVDQTAITSFEQVIRKALDARYNNDPYSALDLIPELEVAPLEEITDTILAWHRDKGFPLKPILATIEKAHTAFDRHMRMKLILEYLLLHK